MSEGFKVVRVRTDENFAEVLKNELAQIGCDSFLETETGFETSVPADAYDENAFQTVFDRYSDFTKIEWEAVFAPKENWNRVWEENYPPVRIGNICLIRAEFHQAEPGFGQEIMITPKMSFGTGHHQTTSMMIRHLSETDLAGKSVIDLGCGTGVLAIYALKCGAKSAKACDIDDWAVENATENAGLNGTDFTVINARAADFAESGAYDIVLANINLNALYEEMSDYARLMKPDGKLFLSGFYSKNNEAIRARAAEFGLREFAEKNDTDWSSLIFVKA